MVHCKYGLSKSEKREALSGLQSSGSIILKVFILENKTRVIFEVVSSFLRSFLLLSKAVLQFLSRSSAFVSRVCSL